VRNDSQWGNFIEYILATPKFPEKGKLMPDCTPNRPFLTATRSASIKVALLLVVTPCLMAQNSTSCTGGNVRNLSTFVWTTCGECMDSRDLFYFDQEPAAPEHPAVLTVEVEGIDEFVDVDDVRAFLILRACGTEAREDFYEIEFESDIQGVTGRVAVIPNECIQFNQRTPAYWEVLIVRSGNTSIRTIRTFSWVEYEDFAQPIRPGDISE